MLGGSKWNFPDNAMIRYAISDSPNNIRFDNNSFPIVRDIADKAFSQISDYTGLNFAYAGRYNSPQEAYLDGIDFSISLMVVIMVNNSAMNFPHLQQLLRIILMQN